MLHSLNLAEIHANIKTDEEIQKLLDEKRDTLRTHPQESNSASNKAA